MRGLFDHGPQDIVFLPAPHADGSGGHFFVMTNGDGGLTLRQFKRELHASGSVVFRRIRIRSMVVGVAWVMLKVRPASQV